MPQPGEFPQQTPQESPPHEPPRTTVEDYENIPPEEPLPAVAQDLPPSFNFALDSDTSAEEVALPDYSRRPDPALPRLPSYARATRPDSRTATIEQLLPTEEERLASLRAFCEEKMYANDYWGGLKGSADGPPNDPFKVFRWAKRKMSGEKGVTWRKMSEEDAEKWKRVGWARDGEIAVGDVDTSRVV